MEQGVRRSANDLLKYLLIIYRWSCTYSTRVRSRRIAAECVDELLGQM